MNGDCRPFDESRPGVMGAIGKLLTATTVKSPMSRRRCLRLFKARPEAIFPGMLLLEAINEHLMRLVRSIILNERIERFKLADMAGRMRCRVSAGCNNGTRA